LFFAWGIAGHVVQKTQVTLSKIKAAFLTIVISILLALQVTAGMQVYANVAILGLEIAILYFALTQTWQIKSRFVGLLGDSSYAQYLVHVPVLTVVVSIFSNRVDSGVLVLISFFAVSATAVATWLLLDRPIGQFGRSLISGS
jgi:peptidoglycan/LPS O-acetylase OafA/YrhL